ncbi:signal recognition particle-docking protein FtsY, partial [Staphylococcus nepalensis]
MSFFKRLKDKFAGKPTEEEKELQDLDQTESSEEDKKPAEKEEKSTLPEAKPKEEPKDDFDFDDGLISIEEFEEIESQKLGAKFRQGLEKSRENFQEQLNNLIARYRTVDEDFFEALEEMLITADVGFNTVME